MTTTARQRAADAALAALVIGVELAVSLATPHWHGAKESRPGRYVRDNPARHRRTGAAGAETVPARGARGGPGRTLGATALGARRAVRPDGGVLHRGAGRQRVAAIGSLVIGYVVSVWDTSAESALLLAAGLATLLSVAELSPRPPAPVPRRTARTGPKATARRASDERLAIARDLHDVVAHSISVINVQANTALHLMDRQPERAREALTAIREVSGQALAELGPVLGALRARDRRRGGRR